jgi:hypothetical protein
VHSNPTGRLLKIPAVIDQHEQSFIRHGLYRLQQQQQKQQKSPMTLNQKVVVWAQGQLGKTKSSVAQRGHHTTIANGKLDANGSLKTLEQHVKPLGEKVQNKTLSTRDVSPAVKKKFEKKLNPTTHKTETVEVTTTVPVTVTGNTWVYRPKPK